MTGTAARYRALFDTAQDAIFVADVETGQLVDANRKALELTGQSLSGIRRLRMIDLHPLREREAVEENFRRFSSTHVGSRNELTLVGLGGVEIPVEVNTGAVTEVGGHRLIIGVFRDLRERLRAEEALRKSEERHRILYEAVADAIYVFEILPDGGLGRFVEVNDVACKRLGYTREELLGMSPNQVDAPEAGFDHQPVIARLRSGLPARFERVHVAKDGRRIPVEVHARAFQLEGRPAILSLVRDISERVRAAEALRESQAELVQAQKMEAVGRLAGGVAHDFNNVLSVILGYGELMAMSLPPEDPDQENLGEILRAADRAAGLTRQLLAFSRRQALDPKILDLRTVVQETQKMLRRLIGEDVRLEVVLPPSLPPVKADPGQIEQVLMNLAVNARDAMPSGGTLTLELSETIAPSGGSVGAEAPASGRWVVLGVHDTGCGMSDEVRQKIFEPFFTTKEKGKGTGLGLSTVYGIVRQSGGLIGVESAPGRGTSFRIHLPVADAEADEDPAPGAADEEQSQGETVLVVEDEETVLSLTRKILETKGYKVLTARNSEEALALERSWPGTIDLLLSDIVLPGMGGWALGEEFLRRRPGTKHLYMSGYTEEAIADPGRIERDFVFLQKPFTPIDLGRAVRSTLRKGRLTRSGLHPRIAGPGR